MNAAFLLFTLPLLCVLQLFPRRPRLLRPLLARRGAPAQPAGRPAGGGAAARGAVAQCAQAATAGDRADGVRLVGCSGRAGRLCTACLLSRPSASSDVECASLRRCTWRSGCGSITGSLPNCRLQVAHYFRREGWLLPLLGCLAQLREVAARLRLPAEHAAYGLELAATATQLQAHARTTSAPAAGGRVRAGVERWRVDLGCGEGCGEGVGWGRWGVLWRSRGGVLCAHAPAARAQEPHPIRQLTNGAGGGGGGASGAVAAVAAAAAGLVDPAAAVEACRAAVATLVSGISPVKQVCMAVCVCVAVFVCLPVYGRVRVDVGLGVWLASGGPPLRPCLHTSSTIALRDPYLPVSLSLHCAACQGIMKTSASGSTEGQGAAAGEGGTATGAAPASGGLPRHFHYTVRVCVCVDARVPAVSEVSSRLRAELQKHEASHIVRVRVRVRVRVIHTAFRWNTWTCARRSAAAARRASCDRLPSSWPDTRSRTWAGRGEAQGRGLGHGTWDMVTWDMGHGDMGHGTW